MLSLNFYIITHFFTGIVAITLGILVFFKNKKKTTNKTFGLLTLGVAVWSFSYSIWLLSEDYNSALFWARTLNMGATLIPVFYLHWIISLLKLNRKKLLIFYYSLTAIFVFFSYSEYYICCVKQVSQFPYWPQLNWLYALFLLFSWCVIIIYSLKLLLKEFRKAKGYRRQQIKYVILGSIVGFMGGSTNYPLMLGIDWIPPIGSPLVIAYPIIFGYSMAKHHLMNIRIIATELLVGLVSFILLVDIVLSKSVSAILLKSGILIVFVYLGWSLIQSVVKEMHKRQELEDLTRQLEEANEQLKKLDKAKSEFVSIASHQLRTPLTVIKGYISMILEGSFGKVNEGEKDSLIKVYLSNERLIRLVENLLNISRIESGRLQFDFEAARVENLVIGVIEDLTGSADNKALRFKSKIPAKPLPKVKIDKEKIRQVIMNLVDNAIKYTKKGGNITVSLARQERNIIFCVSDSGMGIRKEDMPKLFQKFSRGTGTSLVNTEGTGLGLFVAKRIIDAHSGRIWAKSAGAGKGAKFCFILPINDSKQEGS